MNLLAEWSHIFIYEAFITESPVNRGPSRRLQNKAYR